MEILGVWRLNNKYSSIEVKIDTRKMEGMTKTVTCRRASSGEWERLSIDGWVNVALYVGVDVNILDAAAEAFEYLEAKEKLRSELLKKVDDERMAKKAMRDLGDLVKWHMGKEKIEHDQRPAFKREIDAQKARLDDLSEEVNELLAAVAEMESKPRPPSAPACYAGTSPQSSLKAACECGNLLHCDGLEKRVAGVFVERFHCPACGKRLNIFYRDISGRVFIDDEVNNGRK